MNVKLPIELVTEFVELRNLLHSLNQIGWAYNTLNRQYPLENIEQPGLKSLISTYKNLLKDAKEITNKI